METLEIKKHNFITKELKEELSFLKESLTDYIDTSLVKKTEQQKLKQNIFSLIDHDYKKLFKLPSSDFYYYDKLLEMLSKFKSSLNLWFYDEFIKYHTKNNHKSVKRLISNIVYSMDYYSFKKLVEDVGSGKYDSSFNKY